MVRRTGVAAPESQALRPRQGLAGECGARRHVGPDHRIVRAQCGHPAGVADRTEPTADGGTEGFRRTGYLPRIQNRTDAADRRTGHRGISALRPQTAHPTRGIDPRPASHPRKHAGTAVPTHRAGNVHQRPEQAFAGSTDASEQECHFRYVRTRRLQPSPLP